MSVCVWVCGCICVFVFVFAFVLVFVCGAVGTGCGLVLFRSFRVWVYVSRVSIEHWPTCRLHVEGCA